MRILSKQKNHLLHFLNLTRKLNTNVAIDRPSLHIPRSRGMLQTTGAGADHQHKILLQIRSVENDRNFYSILSGERSSWCGCLPHLEDFEIAPSCNGLLHLYNTSNLEGAVWNPSTSEFKFLPPSDVKRPTDTESSAADFSALGFDSKAQDYKILRFLDNYITEEGPDNVYNSVNGYFFQMELYSFKTDSWKEISFDDGRRVYWFKPFVYANGCLYWNVVNCILAFDFAEERFSSLCWPHIGNALRGLYEFELVEVDGSLGCIVCPVVGTRKTFELWVIVGSGSWSKKVSINVSGDMRLLGFLGNGQMLFLQDGLVVMYDCSTNRLKKHNDMHIGPKLTTEAIPYVESKLPLAEQLATSNTSFLMNDP